MRVVPCEVTVGGWILVDDEPKRSGDVVLLPIEEARELAAFGEVTLLVEPEDVAGKST